MTPEEFYYKDRLGRLASTKETIFEMRLRSLSWMLDCFRKGTIRRRTIVNLIPLANLYDMLYILEEQERYEDCIVVSEVINEIYENNFTEIKNKNEPMSIKKQKEIISLLESTIKSEKEKVSGNGELIEKLEKKLQQVRDWKSKG
jgi:uncharacterized protein YfbU (UPF0304 family)